MSDPTRPPPATTTEAPPWCRVYAVVRAAEWQDAPGPVGRVRPRLVRAGELAAVVADEPLEPGLPAARLLLHESVVDALARRGVVAPVAEGCVAAGPEELVRWLEAAAPALQSLLERLEGRCEVGVLAWWDRERASSAAALDATDGAARTLPGESADAVVAAVAAARAQRSRLQAQLAQEPMRSTYLLRRELRAREAAVAAAYGERVAAGLHARVASIAEAGRRGGPPGVDVLLDAAYLMRRARLAELDAAMAELTRAYGGMVTLHRTAPRVPWRFATLRPFAGRRPRLAAAPHGGPA